MIPEVEKISKPGDRLFVGTGDLRKTPFSEAWLYYMFPQLTPRPTTSRWIPASRTASTRVSRRTSRRPTSSSSHRLGRLRRAERLEKFGPDTPNQVLRDKFCSVGVYGNGLYELLKRCKP